MEQQLDWNTRITRAEQKGVFNTDDKTLAGDWKLCKAAEVLPLRDDFGDILDHPDKEITSRDIYNKYGSMIEDIGYMFAHVGMAVDEGYMRCNPIESGYGFDVDAFTVTEKGDEVLCKLKSEFSDFYNKILKITSVYQDYVLGRLLREIFFKYSKYLVTGDDRGTEMYESDRYVQEGKNVW